MKKIKLLLVIITMLVFAACKNDVNVSGEWAEIPIIYGLLDADSSAQYIKIQKAFLDKTLSAYTMAKTADSLYIKDELKVIIKGIDVYGNEKSTLNFSLVNGDTIPGFYKPAGTFAHTPNYFYRLKSKLDAQLTYHLIVQKKSGEVIATANTNLIKTTTFRRPSYSSTATNGYSLFSKPDNVLTLSFETDKNAALADMVMRVNYTETNTDNSITSKKYFDWIIAGGVELINGSPANGALNYNGGGFYTECNRRIAINNKLKRTFDGLDFFIHTGNQTFIDYMNAQRAQSGFSSNNSQPIYTNIEGGGIGIFASRNTSILKNIQLNSSSLDSLKYGQYTKNLGFDK